MHRYNEDGGFEHGDEEMTNEFRGGLDVNQARSTMEVDRTRILAMVGRCKLNGLENRVERAAPGFIY